MRLLPAVFGQTSYQYISDNILQPNPTLCLSPQQTSEPPRRALGHAMQSFQRPNSYRKNGLI